MTLSTTTSRVTHSGAGRLGPFAFPFKILAPDDLRVTKRSAAGNETTLIFIDDYSVSGVRDIMGNVTLMEPLASGETLTIRRVLHVTQDASIPSEGDHLPSTIEDQFDRLVMIDQQLEDVASRSLRLAESFDPSQYDMILREVTAGKVVTGTGTGLTMSALDAGAVMLPGGGRTVPTLSAYLANNAVANLKDFGLLDGGVIDEPFALAKAAIPKGGTIVVPATANFYLQNSRLATPDGTPYIIVGEGYSSRIRKNFNGDMLSLGKQSILRDLHLDGNGGRFTGRGVVITTGGIDLDSWRGIENCFIKDTAGYPVEYTGANAGYASWIHRSILAPVSAATACVKMPAVSENGNREIVGGWFNGPVVDCDHTGNLTIIGVQASPPIFSPTCVKVRCIGNRFSNGGAVVIDGIDTVFIGNALVARTSITFAPTMNGCTYEGNNDSHSGAPYVDKANGSNFIDFPGQLYTPGWAGGSPAVGDGSIAAKYARRGQCCRVTIVLTIGSTTRLGGAGWTFTLPYVAGRNEVGQVYIRQTKGGIKYHAGVCWTGGGRDLLALAVTPDLVGNTKPGTWAPGDTLYADIEYFIQ